jgi:hypothetical protein
MIRTLISFLGRDRLDLDPLHKKLCMSDHVTCTRIRVFSTRLSGEISHERKIRSRKKKTIKMSGHIPKLHYFPLSARAEFARLLWEDTKTPYEFVKVPFGEHLKNDKLPFGQLPILEEDGFVLAQSGTIARYVAKKVGLYPADAKEAATAGMTIEKCNIFTL